MAFSDFALVDPIDGRKWGTVGFGTSAYNIKYSFAQFNLAGAAYNFGPLTDAMKVETQRAFATWSRYADITFSLVEDSQVTNTGGIRIGLADIDGPLNREAEAVRMANSSGNIKASQIAVDSAEGWHVGADGKVYDAYGTSFFHLILHEIGHALGLGHYDTAPAVMNRANGNLTDLLPSDIHGIQYIYGVNPSIPGVDIRVEISSIDLGGFNKYYSNIQPGGLLDISINAFNDGRFTAGTGDIALVISSDSVISSEDRVIGWAGSLGLPAYGSSTLSNYKVALPADLKAGTYYLGAIADYKNNYPFEISETNNTSSAIAITVTSDGGPGIKVPDYVSHISKLSIRDSGGKPADVVTKGSFIDIEAEMSNLNRDGLPQGGQELWVMLSKDKEIGFSFYEQPRQTYDDDRVLKFIYMGDVYAGGPYPVKATVQIPDTFDFGLYYIATKAQPLPRYEEARVANNVSNIIEIAYVDKSMSKDGKPLVDDYFYNVNNKDVLAVRADADQHYLDFGWREGRDPNSHFSTTGYLAANLDVAKAGMNPLTHYDLYGWPQGRDPSANFDNELYLARNADVKAAGMNPLAHFLQYGQAEGRQAYAAVGKASDLAKDPGFDAEYYLLANPDVARAALNAGGDTFEFAHQHYESYGWQYGRNPNAVFDTKGYLATHKDVAAAGMDPLEHYHKYGFSEGRDPSAQFDTKAYLAANPDVKAVGYDAMLHYLQYGGVEGRTAFNDGHFG